jgi:Cys-tRNA(Pro)/Cys-tRNA(Cys) deacylase
VSKATRATKALEQAGVSFTVHSYDYDPDADKIGIQAAEALNEAPERVLAAAFGGKSAQMMRPADAERATGYKVGGISPFGQMRATKTAVEEQALAHGLVYLNGGQRGLQVRLDPRVAADVLKAIIAPIVA